MALLLVTGGCGFLGSHFIRHLLAARSDVRLINLDALTDAGNLANLDDLAGHLRYRFVKGDLEETAAWYRANAAWMHSVTSGAYRRDYERQYGRAA